MLCGLHAEKSNTVVWIIHVTTNKGSCTDQNFIILNQQWIKQETINHTTTALYLYTHTCSSSASGWWRCVTKTICHLLRVQFTSVTVWSSLIHLSITLILFVCLYFLVTSNAMLWLVGLADLLDCDQSCVQIHDSIIIVAYYTVVQSYSL